MKLFVIPVSPNCRQAEAVVHHLGMDVEVVNLETTPTGLSDTEISTHNPNGTVPVLLDGDFKLWESRAIMQYLAGRHGASDFFPADAAKRADIARWIFWEALHYNKAVGAICWETIAKPVLGLGDADESAIEAGTANFHRFAPILNDQLGGKAFITGDNLTLADFAVGSHAALIKSARSRVPIDQYPNIAAWHRRLDEVPGWDATKPPFEL